MATTTDRCLPPVQPAYGTVDELNAMIGTITSMNIETKLDSCLERIQNDLFDLGADLCLPEDTTGHINPEPLRHLYDTLCECS